MSPPLPPGHLPLPSRTESDRLGCGGTPFPAPPRQPRSPPTRHPEQGPCGWSSAESPSSGTSGTSTDPEGLHRDMGSPQGSSMAGGYLGRWGPRCAPSQPGVGQGLGRRNGALLPGAGGVAGESALRGPPGSGGLGWAGTASSSPHLGRRTAPGAGGSRRGGPLLLGLTQWPWKVQKGGRAGGRPPLGSAPRPPLHTASAPTRSSLLSTPAPPDLTRPHITPQLLQHLSTHSLPQACQAPV